MAVPDRKAMMGPILTALADGRDHSSVEVRDAVARRFHLSQEDRAQQAGNSAQDRFTNEHAFALVDLQRLKLITKPDQHQFVYRITDRGRAELRGGSLPPDDSIFDRAPDARTPVGIVAQQRRSVPVVFAERYALHSGSDVYALRVSGNAISILKNGIRDETITKRLQTSVVNGALTFRLGEAAAEDFGQASSETLYAALLIAAVTGHPDATSTAAPRVVWSPHIAVALGEDPRLARTKTPIRSLSVAVLEMWQAGARLVDLEPAATTDPTSATEEGPQRPRDGHRSVRRTVIETKQAPIEGYEYWRPEARVVAEQREFELVARFRAFLTAAGREHRQEQLRVHDTWITYDLFDVSCRILFEAKADASAREQVRMAIGQLFDYGYHGFESTGNRLNKAILLPAEPPDDVAEVLGYLEIGIAYETSVGDFVEEYPWT